MDIRGVPESEWRKVSDCTHEVDRVRNRYDSLLRLFENLAGRHNQYVPNLSFEHAEGVAIIKSFAGESHLRLGWDASGDELKGVLIFTSVDSVTQFQVEILRATISYSGAVSLPLSNGENFQERNFHAMENVAYALLMNLVRKQVDFSSKT